MLVSVFIFVYELNLTILVSTTLALVLVVTRYTTGASLKIFFKPWEHWNYSGVINYKKDLRDSKSISSYAEYTPIEDYSNGTVCRSPDTTTTTISLRDSFGTKNRLSESDKSQDDRNMLVENILIQESMLYGKIRPKKNGADPNPDPALEFTGSLPSIIIDTDIGESFLVEQLNNLASMMGDDADWLHRLSPQTLATTTDDDDADDEDEDEEDDEDEEELISEHSSPEAECFPSIFTSSSTSSESLLSSTFSMTSLQLSKSATSLDEHSNTTSLPKDELPKNKGAEGKEEQGYGRYLPSLPSMCPECSVETGATRKLLNDHPSYTDGDNRLPDLNELLLHCCPHDPYYHYYRHNCQQFFNSNHSHPRPHHNSNQETVEGFSPKSAPSLSAASSLHPHKHKRQHSMKCSNSTTTPSKQTPTRHSPSKREKKSKKVRNPLKKINKTVTLYRKMPLRSLSRLWGKVNQLDLPVFLRIPVFKVYIWAFGCKLEEAEEEDLKTYKNLGEFFRRTLKPQVRPIDEINSLTSPSDGTITHFGKVENGVIKQVKGVNFSVEGFLGPISWKFPFSQKMTTGSAKGTLDENQNILPQLIHPENVLYNCVIYLAPGDYHRFHSPTDWIVCYRRHFPGELLSVHPGMARWIKGLFNLNERAMYVGLWKHGFFSMTAVGATNVGSIRIYNDHELATNTGKKPDGTYSDRYLPNEENPGVPVEKGDLFGEFNLGSTIVLIFEAPKDFQFNVKAGQRIKYGEAVGT